MALPGLHEWARLARDSQTAVMEHMMQTDRSTAETDDELSDATRAAALPIPVVAVMFGAISGALWWAALWWALS